MDSAKNTYSVHTKAKSKMTEQCEQYKRIFQKQHEMGRQKSSQMEKCYRGCRQRSDPTRRHNVYFAYILSFC